MLTADQGKRLNQECATALSGVLRKVKLSNPDLHARFVMSNCKIALRYLQYIHQIGIDGYSPIAVSLFRTYYEIVCATMFLAENKGELDDFLQFGRRMHFEIGQAQKFKGKLLNELIPDHEELRQRFLKKRKGRGQSLSWHGMTIEALGSAVGMEKYADQQLVRSQYMKASKLVHGDSLLALLAYNLEQEQDVVPTPFAPPMEVFRIDAMAATCPLFIALLASVDVGLLLGFQQEIDTLNAVWKSVWDEAVAVQAVAGM